MDSEPKYSSLAPGRGLGGNRGGKDGCEGWSGGSGAFTILERGCGLGDGGLTAGCLGGGAKVLFLSSDMVDVEGESNKAAARSPAQESSTSLPGVLWHSGIMDDGSKDQKYRHGHSLLNHVRPRVPLSTKAFLRVRLFKIQSARYGRISAESTLKPVGSHRSHSNGQRRQSDFVRCQSSRRRL